MKYNNNVHKSLTRYWLVIRSTVRLRVRRAGQAWKSLLLQHFTSFWSLIFSVSSTVVSCESLCHSMLLLRCLGFFSSPLELILKNHFFFPPPFIHFFLIVFLTWLKSKKNKSTFVCSCGIKIKKDYQVYVSLALVMNVVPHLW